MPGIKYSLFGFNFFFPLAPILDFLFFYALPLQVKIFFIFMTVSSICLSQCQQVTLRFQSPGTLILIDRSLDLSSPDYTLGVKKR